MLLLIFAIVLACFWVRASRMTPAKYPNVDQEVVMTHRTHLLQLYRRYAGFFIILVILAIANGMLRGYGLTHKAAGFVYASDILTLVITAIGIYVLFIAAKNALANYRKVKSWP